LRRKTTAIVKPCKPPTTTSPSVASPDKSDNNLKHVLTPETADSSHITVMTTHNTDSIPDTDSHQQLDRPVVPSKGYTRDLLEDSLLDPLQTKSAVENDLSSSKVTDIKQENKEWTDGDLTGEIGNQKLQQTYQSLNKDMSKNNLNEEVNKKAVIGSVEAVSDVKELVNDVDEFVEEDVIPPAKGYNLDFLNNLDDPNYNPFETKTAVLNKFESSDSSCASKIVENVETTENTDVKIEEKVKKPLVKKPVMKKPFLKKTMKKPDQVSQESIPKEAIEHEGEGDLVPAVPAKSYNMDFLDKLDDPNFNPFETKTAVSNKFDTTPAAAVPNQAETSVPANDVLEVDEKTSIEKKTEEPAELPVTKKAVVKKPWLKKTIAKKKPPAPSIDDEPKAEEDSVKPPQKAYNLDFLDKLDDPNFNPFETKTSVVDKFEHSAPVPEDSNDITQDTYKTLEEPVNVPEATVKAENNVEEKKEKKPLPKKPWQKKTSKKESSSEKTVSDDKVTDIENGIDDDLNLPPVPVKGYNLDFLDKLDDPNFNPFETKSAVKNVDVESSEISQGNAVAISDVPLEAVVSDEIVEADKIVEEKVKKPLPKKPWLKKVSKKESSSEKTISDNLFVDTNYAVDEAELPPVQGKGYNLDFLDNLDDPNFNPFETKNTVKNVISESSNAPNEEPKAISPIPSECVTADIPECSRLDETIITSKESAEVKDSTPEFELNEAEILEPSGWSTRTTSSSPPSQSPLVAPTHSSMRPPLTLSPPPSSTSSGYSTLPQSTQDRLSQAMTDSTEISFCIPEPLNMESLMNGDLEEDMDDVHLEDLPNLGPPLREEQEENAWRQSDISVETLLRKTSSGPGFPTGEGMAQLGLLHEARLLEKDRELSRLGLHIREQEKEMDKLRSELSNTVESNRAMMGIVEEFEKTISQLIAEKEREAVCNQITREKLLTERNQILEDLQAVERAFNDLHRKYERTKEVVAGFKSNEDVLKRTVEELSTRCKKGEERYEMLKDHAEMKLNEANNKIEEMTKNKSGEIAKLTAQLRKSEMKVSSLERQVEQKTRENQELTTICDELISKVGS